LYRNLKGVADEIVVCDPRRNAHIAKDDDKDDAIDAEKLNNLYRSGYLRVVHQSDSSDHAANKQLVGMYHSRVKRRIAEGMPSGYERAFRRKMPVGMLQETRSRRSGAC